MRLFQLKDSEYTVYNSIVLHKHLDKQSFGLLYQWEKTFPR